MDKEKSDNLIAFRLPHKWREEIRKDAHDLYISMSEWIKQAIREKLEKRRGERNV